MTPHTWKFYTVSEDAWRAMLEDCRHAEKTIDLEQYVFGGDEKIIWAFTRVFRQKARQGVKIRLLVDAVGSWHFYRSKPYKALLEMGIEIIYHRGAIPLSIKRLIPLFLRDHRKLMVIDQKIAHIGGVIIQERARFWRDTAIRIEGKVVEELQRAFDVAWDKLKAMQPMGSVISKKEVADFTIAGNSFRLGHKEIYRSFIRNITEAKKYIYITTPYFSPNSEFRRALYYAHEKGVDVRILLPKGSDNVFSDMIAKYFFTDRLLRHGIRLFRYRPSIFHAKTMVIDDEWASVGSCNMDWLSFWLNYELNINSTNRAFATELREIFMSDLAFADELKRQKRV